MFSRNLLPKTGPSLSPSIIEHAMANGVQGWVGFGEGGCFQPLPEGFQAEVADLTSSGRPLQIWGAS